MSELAQKRTRWEIITLGCMFIGYMGFILSRTILAVVSPELVLGPPHFQSDVCLPLFLAIAVAATLIIIWFAFEDYRHFKPTSGKVSV